MSVGWLWQRGPPFDAQPQSRSVNPGETMLAASDDSAPAPLHARLMIALCRFTKLRINRHQHAAVNAVNELIVAIPAGCSPSTSARCAASSILTRSIPDELRLDNGSSQGVRTRANIAYRQLCPVPVSRVLRIQ